MTNTTPLRSAPSAPVLRARNLRKHYSDARRGDHEVLRGVDLEIAPGETYALLGPNGAGKSTTIEILEGFRRASGGEITVLGDNPLTAPRSWRARIGIVSQQTGDLGPYTPRELLAHFAGLYPQARGVDEVLELVGLTEHAARRASKLSGGQQRRLDVALGIIGRPELLFLDEPTTGFDPEARRQFWGMLETLSGDGTAILLTTHYLDEAARLADRVGVLTGGRIVAEAPPEQLGGADARVPVVRWRGPSGEPREERSSTPAAIVERLRAEALAAGLPAGEPLGLEVRRPTLEEIYLGLLATHEAAGASADATPGADAPAHPQTITEEVGA